MPRKRWSLYLWSEGDVQVARYESLRELISDHHPDSAVHRMIEEAIWGGTHMLTGLEGETKGMVVGRLDREEATLPAPMGWVEFRYSAPWAAGDFEATLEEWKRRLREEGNADWRWFDSPRHYAYRHDGVHAMAFVPSDGSTCWYIDGEWMPDQEAEERAPGKRSMAHYRLVRGG